MSHTSLVLNADLNLLLGWGNHFVFDGTLQVGQFIDRLLDDLQRLLDFFVGDDQWWCQTDDVLVSGLGLESR